MWKFSLREVVLVTTVFGIAMAVNVWNHRDLRQRLERTEEYAASVRGYAAELRSELGYAKEESDRVNARIERWFASGELKPVPRAECMTGRMYPDWTILDSPAPNMQ